MNELWTTSLFAARSGLTKDTLRYYERIGLLDPIYRLANGHRRYRPVDLRRVGFLKRLRTTGMPITEMKRYVDLFRPGDTTMAARRVMLERHRRSVREQLANLQETLDLLDQKIDGYRRRENGQLAPQQIETERAR